MNDFTAEPPELRDAMLGAVRRVLDSGWYVLGKEVEEFEEQWAAVCGVPSAVGVGTGLDAIEICLRALDIGPGDEVITTSMTAFATVLAVMRAGATPVLADIDPDTALLSRDSVERCITSRTKAIVLVHLYGQVRDMDAWQSLCAQYDLALLEDCAQAHQASWRGELAGSFGLAGAYSFYPTKNLGALGDAGMVVTHREDIAERAKRLRNYGQSKRYYHPDIGMNSRLDELQAAILLERLKWLSKFTERRREIAQTYLTHIKTDQLGLLDSPQEPLAHVYHLFVVTCNYRDALQSHLGDYNIQSLIHYPVSVHRQKPCMSMQQDPAGLENSERHATTCISLPCHPQMADEQVAAVIDAVNAFRVT